MEDQGGQMVNENGPFNGKVKGQVMSLGPNSEWMKI